MSHPLAELLEVRVGDCGCPEEAYLFGGIDLAIHFEPTGETDAFMDGGDWGEAELTVWTACRVEARSQVFAWAEKVLGV